MFFFVEEWLNGRHDDLAKASNEPTRAATVNCSVPARYMHPIEREGASVVCTWIHTNTVLIVRAQDAALDTKYISIVVLLERARSMAEEESEDANMSMKKRQHLDHQPC